ncbi:zinc finger protein ZAT9-like [Bidens hawaiensis]|uniref:zinc finger protein ZAT9-like n=1 Tax=Bidens hawaiensis TaxID=980011 RepID=UPI00404AD9D9
MKKDDQPKRVCLECDKQFTSGKALGGHMRIHLQSQPRTTNYKNPNFTKPSGKPSYYMNCVNHEGKPTCSQCGKTFLTMKSLFGHMRCHPERLWRGILPPLNTPAAVVRRRDDEVVVDLTKYLRRWPVTERRGRKSLLKPADHQNDNNDVVLLEAVEDLLSFANAGGDSVTEEIDSQLHKVKRKKKKMKLMMDLDVDRNAVTLPLAPVTEELAVNNKYKCTSCNKGFATHQALGGHRSSHNKYKLITSATDHHIQEHDQVHQCKVCDKVFATGQALGGHKRCHWGGVIASESAQALSSQITSAESGRKVLDFDLNEMPPMMMMEEEDDDQYASVNGVNGNGYASSSYNSNMG